MQDYCTSILILIPILSILKQLVLPRLAGLDREGFLPVCEFKFPVNGFNDFLLIWCPNFTTLTSNF